MKLFWRHAIDGGLVGLVLSIVVGFDDPFILILVVYEVEVIFSVWIEFDGSICHSYL